MTTLGLFRGVIRDALGHLNATPDVDPTQTFYRRNLARIGLDDRADALTTQVMTSVPIYLQAGDTVTNLSFISGATAANAPTNWWFAPVRARRGLHRRPDVLRPVQPARPARPGRLRNPVPDRRLGQAIPVEHPRASPHSREHRPG